MEGFNGKSKRHCGFRLNRLTKSLVRIFLWPMKKLNCETVETTYASLRQIYNIEEQDINKFLEIDLDAYYNCSLKSYISPNDLILELLEQKLGKEGEYNRTYWFHITRQPKSNKFPEGILPLGQSINSIWEFLYSLIQNEVSRSKWDEFRKGVENDNGNEWADMYRLKVRDINLHGPYGVLVREIAFKPSEVDYYNYFESPEIIRDISNCFNDEYGIDLLHIFRNNTQPCIVKIFKDAGKRGYIGCALYYLYCKFHNQTLSSFCFADFDGGGRLVSEKQIEEVTFYK